MFIFLLFNNKELIYFYRGAFWVSKIPPITAENSEDSSLTVRA